MSIRNTHTIKAVLIAAITSVILAVPLFRLAVTILSQGGLIKTDIVLALPFGLIFSVPLVFGFLSTLYFGKNYKELALFVVIPTFLAAFVWSSGGNMQDFFEPFSVGLGLGVVGTITSFITKFIYGKFKKV